MCVQMEAILYLSRHSWEPSRATNGEVFKVKESD